MSAAEAAVWIVGMIVGATLILFLVAAYFSEKKKGASKKDIK